MTIFILIVVTVLALVTAINSWRGSRKLARDLKESRLETDWLRGKISGLKADLNYCADQPTYDRNDLLAGLKVMRDQLAHVAQELRK